MRGAAVLRHYRSMNAGPTTSLAEPPVTASRRRILARTRLDFWLDALLAGPALRRLLPRQVIGARRHRRVPAVGEISRSSRAMRSSGSAILASLSSTSSRSRPADSRSRAFSARSSAASPGTPAVSGASGTPVLHQGRPSVSNAAHLTGQGPGKAG